MSMSETVRITVNLEDGKTGDVEILAGNGKLHFQIADTSTSQDCMNAHAAIAKLRELVKTLPGQRVLDHQGSSQKLGGIVAIYGFDLE